ncbi:MAG: PilZ domain-containing protein [Methylococcaceae bacterium]|nr:PilZ domain-containing protein [Methylococcaceae bacterium]
MIQNRKEYRKTFTSSGQLYMAGELLNFIGYDISVKGIQVEILPGTFLSEAEDFEKVIRENATAEIFVKDLMLTGEVHVAWVNKSEDGIMLGLEFRDVIYNAEKLWHKRRYYRKHKKAIGTIIHNDDSLRIAFESINVSTDGIMVYLKESASHDLYTGVVVKILSLELDIKAVAKVAWIDSKTRTTLGLRYLQVDGA